MQHWKERTPLLEEDVDELIGSKARYILREVGTFCWLCEVRSAKKYRGFDIRDGFSALLDLAFDSI